MEACGANFLDEDWESLSKMFSFSIEECIISYSDETDQSSLNFLNQQNLSYDHGLTCYHQDNNTSELSMNFHIDDNLNTSTFSDDHHRLTENVLSLKPEIWCSNEQLRLRENDDSINGLQLKRNYVETSPQAQDDSDNSSEGPQKKARARRNYKSKSRATQPRKNKEVTVDRDSNEEETINDTKGKRSSSCCSINIFDQEDSIPNDNSSQEISKSLVSLNSNGKAKATRGSATDSQSLYARRRRERINERLKILQSLVPNGTKVDISTMLEEAVHYVKFLQLQIKLLTSDELWMYAPIAYNGLVDIGMYQKICPNQRP